MNKKNIFVFSIGIIVILITSLFIINILNNMNTEEYKVDDNYISKTTKEPDTVKNIDKINKNIQIEKPEIEPEPINTEIENENIEDKKEDVIQEQQEEELVEKVESEEKITEEPVVKHKEPVESKPQTVKEEIIPEVTPKEEKQNENIDEQTEQPQQQEEELIAYTGNEWADEKVNEHKDEIVDDDLDEGLSIGEKLDSDKIQELLEDGLTDEEEKELKSYLLETLTTEEYQALKDLYSKYNHILEE